MNRKQSSNVVIAAAYIFACVLVFGMASAAPPANGAGGAKPLSNADIVNMVQAGLPQEVVIEKIKASKTSFDTSTEALVALKKAGVSDAVIRLMVNPAAEVKPAGTVVSPFVDTRAPEPCQVRTGDPAPWLSGASPAMWYREPGNGERVEINYERGTISHVGFAGFGARLLVLHPLKARVRVSGEVQFATCLNPTDAPLVRFSLDRDSNERNTSVGRTTPWTFAFNISQEDLVPFKFEKTPDGYFKIMPDGRLKPGEYGFVPQGTVGYFTAGERVYTFGVD